MISGDYCWQLIATATPFSYNQGPPVSLQPGQSGTAEFGTSRHSALAGVSVDVPESDLAAVAQALRRPSFIVVTTDDILGLGSTFRFHSNCPGAITGPTQDDREQHVNLSSTAVIKCDQLPQLGSGF